MRKISPKNFLILIVIAVTAWYLYQQQKPQQKSMYQVQPSSIPGSDPMGGDEEYAPASLKGTGIDLSMAACAMNNGVGLSSSLLPREMASQEDYSQFAPDDILKGQNFLDARSQIGWPETIGGTLRNANHQLRADPPVSKRGYVWNNSTISPDIMQRSFC